MTDDDRKRLSTEVIPTIAADAWLAFVDSHIREIEDRVAASLVVPPDTFRADAVGSRITRMLSPDAPKYVLQGGPIK